MSNFVFVLDSNKKPLDPCHPSVARKLLKNNKAAVIRKYPFTIILKKVVNTPTSSYELKLDPGSKTTGIALVKKDSLIWGALLNHRGVTIKSDLETRRSIRRSRRNRKTRYRKPRFLNRTNLKGWLAPSLKHRVLTTMTWVNRLRKICPIDSLTIELVKFDTQLLQNPEISGTEYQQGTLAGYEVREYLKEKWSRKCTYCSKENVPLQIEHIKPKAKGGSNRISNLCLACEKCNQRKGVKDIKYFLKGKPDLLKKILKQIKQPLTDAAAINTTRWDLFKSLKELGLEVKTGSGGLTKFNRTRLNLPKTHWIDAGCVGEIEQLKIVTTKPLIIKAVGHGNRRLCRINKYGFPCSKPRRVYHHGWKTGDIGKHFSGVKGRIVVQSDKRLEVRVNKKRIGGKLNDFKKIFSKDGYEYGG